MKRFVLLALSGLFCLGAFRDFQSQVSAFDTGIYLQLLGNAFHHYSLASSLTGEKNFLAHHFQPLILLFSPVVALLPSAPTLFALSCIRLWICFFTLGKKYAPLGLWILILHPSVNRCLYYSFVPEILTLAALCYVARALVSKNVPNVFTLQVCLLVIGLSKESLWMTSSACSLAFALTPHLKPKEKLLWLMSALIYAAVFAFLFFWWMPANSQAPSYYGLRFFVGEKADDSMAFTHIIQVLWENFFSFRSLETFVFSMMLPLMALPLLGQPRLWLATAPTLGLILCSQSFQHHLENHYMMPVLPFFAVAAVENLTKFKSEWLHRSLATCVVAQLVWWTVFSDPGVLESLATATRGEHLSFIARDARRISDELKLVKDGTRFVAADSNLALIFAKDFETIDWFAFMGNPRPVSEKNIGEISDLITRLDFSSPEICPGLARESKEIKLLCEKIPQDPSKKTVYSDSKIFRFILK